MKELLGLWLNDARHSRDVKQLAQKHIELLQQKIADMQNMMKILQQSVAQCAGDEQSDCQIQNRLSRVCHMGKLRIRLSKQINRLELISLNPNLN